MSQSYEDKLRQVLRETAFQELKALVTEIIQTGNVSRDRYPNLLERLEEEAFEELIHLVQQATASDRKRTRLA